MAISEAGVGRRLRRQCAPRPGPVLDGESSKHGQKWSLVLVLVVVVVVGVVGLLISGAAMQQRCGDQVAPRRRRSWMFVGTVIACHAASA